MGSMDIWFEGDDGCAFFVCLYHKLEANMLKPEMCSSLHLTLDKIKVSSFDEILPAALF